MLGIVGLRGAGHEVIGRTIFGAHPQSAGTIRLGGETIPAEQLRRTHLEWYAQNPQAVEVGLRKYADQLRLLGLAG